MMHCTFGAIRQDRNESNADQRVLSSSTIAALRGFYAERETQEKRFEDLKAQIESQALPTPLSMDMFSEDWNASQFWVFTMEAFTEPHS